MDTDELRRCLQAAVEAGIRSHAIPTWAKGTEMERQNGAFVRAPETMRRQLAQYVQKEPALEMFNEKMFNTGFSSARITVETFVTWLLYSTKTNGVDKTIHNLERYLDLDHTPALEVLALTGVEVELEVTLANGVYLVPFKSLQSSFVKNALAPALLKSETLVRAGLLPPWSLNRRRSSEPTAALLRDVRLSPKSQSPDEPPAFLHRTEVLFDACECLTLVSDCTPLPNAHWVEVLEWVPCSSFVGSGWSDPIHDVINPAACKLSPEQGIEARAIHERFVGLQKSVRDKLRVPIQRLNQARRRQQLADKAIDLGIAFEALFLGDQSEREQLALVFRLRGAWYLGRDKDDRAKLVNTFRAVYSCRSMAVHTGKLGSDVEVSGRGRVETTVFLGEADALCVQAISKVIGQGRFPDWQRLVLG